MSLRKNFEYIRDWCNAKFLKKTDQVDIDLSNYYTKSEIESNVGSALKSLSDNTVWETQGGGGIAVRNNGNLASGDNSVSEGYGTYAFGVSSHAEGYQTIAGGENSHAEGYQARAIGSNSHAEGNDTIAHGDYSHVEGCDVHAIGDYSHAEGWGDDRYITAWTRDGNTFTKSYHNLKVGDILCAQQFGNTVCQADYFTVTEVPSINTFVVDNVPSSLTSSMGLRVADSASYGPWSHTEGYRTVTKNANEHAEGAMNLSNTGNTNESRTLHSIGIGTGTTRKNAFEVMQNGDAYLHGVGGYDGTNYASATTLQNVIANFNSTKLDVTAYEVDEEVIAAALNDLNKRIQALSDQRLYRNGAILDLSGENNPNYTIQAGQNEIVLNDDVYNAIMNDRIFTIYIEQKNSANQEPRIYHIAKASWNTNDDMKIFYSHNAEVYSEVTEYPYSGTCDYLYVTSENKILQFGNGCD